MAVRAADHAAGDLLHQAVERGLPNHHVGDVRGLCPDVIEVEHDAVRLPTVDAARALQDPRDEGGVASTARAHFLGRRPAGGRPPAMAADADHLAERDLFIEPPGGGAVMGELAHVGSFASDVIELENDRVGLTAVDARVRAEIGEEMPLPSCAPTLERGPRLRAMQIAALSEVLPEAPSAAVLPGAERGRWLRNVTAAAAPQHVHRADRESTAHEGLGADAFEQGDGGRNVTGPEGTEPTDAPTDAAIVRSDNPRSRSLRASSRLACRATTR